LKSGEPLDYESPQPPARFSFLSLVAFVTSIVACPCLCIIPKTRPFWSGHTLWVFGRVLIQVPPYILPPLSLALSIVSLYRFKPPSRLKGQALAAVALVLSLLWMAVLVFGAIIAYNLPVPHPD